jgi:glycosyltransferase involved in cell wall biosynthesis
MKRTSKGGSRWPVIDWWLSILLLILLFVYIYFVYVSLPNEVNYLAALPVIILLTFLIDGVKNFVEATIVYRKFFHVPVSRVHYHTNLSVLITCHNGEDKISSTVRNVKCALPGSTVYVVDDCSEDNSAHAAMRAGAKVLKLGSNRGKVGALHKLLMHIKSEYVLIMDDDMLISGINIPYSLLDLFDAVAFNVLPKGDSFISRLQRYEYRKSMEIGKNYHATTGSVLCVSGAIGFFRTKRLLEQVSRHSGEFSGEDLERTLLVHACEGSRGVTYTDSIVKTEVPQSMKMLFRQRCLGWNPGFIGNARLLFHILISKRKPLQLRIDALYNLANVPLDTLRILALPVLIKYPIFFLVMYVMYLALDILMYLVTNQKDSLLVVLISPLYGVFCLVTRFIGMLIYFYRELTELVYWRMRHIPDSYKRAPLSLQMVSSLAIICLELIVFIVALRTLY